LGGPAACYFNHECFVFDVTHVILSSYPNNNGKSGLMISYTVCPIRVHRKLKMYQKYTGKRRIMDWKKPLVMAALTGTIILVTAGCSQSAPTATAIEQQTTATTGSAITPVPTAPQSENGTLPAPGNRSPGERPSSPQIDLSAAAEKLGITEEELRGALNETGQAGPDLSAAAEKLGISVEELQQALGFPDMVSPPEGTMLPPDNLPTAVPGDTTY
jgi:hypothetical protein